MLPTWTPLPHTKGIPVIEAAQQRAHHRRLMAMRWRTGLLRERDRVANRLPEDWHDWMCCDAAEYKGYNCTCDRVRPTEPPKRYKTVRVLPGSVAVDMRHVQEHSESLAANPPSGRCVESAMTLLLDYLTKTPDAQARFHARSSPYRSPARTYAATAYPAESDERPVELILSKPILAAKAIKPFDHCDVPGDDSDGDVDDIIDEHHEPAVALDLTLFGQDCPYDDSIVAYQPNVTRAQPVSRDRNVTVGGSWIESDSSLVWVVDINPFSTGTDKKAAGRLRPHQRRQRFQRLSGKYRVRVPMGAGRIRRFLSALWGSGRAERAVLQNN